MISHSDFSQLQSMSPNVIPSFRSRSSINSRRRQANCECNSSAAPSLPGEFAIGTKTPTPPAMPPEERRTTRGRMWVKWWMMNLMSTWLVKLSRDLTGFRHLRFDPLRNMGKRLWWGSASTQEPIYDFSFLPPRLDCRPRVPNIHKHVNELAAITSTACYTSQLIISWGCQENVPALPVWHDAFVWKWYTPIKNQALSSLKLSCLGYLSWCL
jgi:hypothetical protein